MRRQCSLKHLWTVSPMVPWSGVLTFGQLPQSHLGCKASAGDRTGRVLHNMHINSDVTIPPSDSAYPVRSQALALHDSEPQGHQECQLFA